MTKLEALVLEWQEAKRADREATLAQSVATWGRLVRASEALMAYQVRGNQ